MDVSLYTIKQLEEILHHEIPLSLAMGVRVYSYDGQALCLAAPLENNINHKSTAFGGSLYAIAVLSGWALLAMKLNERSLQGEIIIQDAGIRYVKPVKTTIYATALWPEQMQASRFFGRLERGNRARLTLQSKIKQENEEAVKFTGRYVVSLDGDTQSATC